MYSIGVFTKYFCPRNLYFSCSPFLVYLYGQIDATYGILNRHLKQLGTLFSIFVRFFIQSSQWSIEVHIIKQHISSKFRTSLLLSLVQAYFSPPDGTDPVAINLGSMGKGQAWVNGHHIGRYWTLVAPKDGCAKKCDYRGAYNSAKCTTNCGRPTQTWYVLSTPTL